MIINDRALYQAILDRRSVRQYRSESLDPAAMARVAEILSSVEPLNPGQLVQHYLLDDIERADRVVAQGAYGRFIISPHILLPYLEGDERALVEVGFQSEQFAVKLCQMGIGTCYVGAAGREARMLRHFSLPKYARTAAVIMFGLPAEDPKRSMATYFRSPDKKRRRLPVDSLFLDGVLPPEEFMPLIEAGRRAPSATNAQPWRFIWREGHLFVFLHHRPYPVVLSDASRKTYMWHDGGLVLSNIHMALRAAGIAKTWKLGARGVESPMAPPEFVLLASLKLE